MNYVLWSSTAINCTLNEFWRIRRRCSFSLSNGSLQRRTNDRLYSNREEDLCSLTGDRLVLSRALYKSTNESAWCLRSRSGPTEGSEELLTITPSFSQQLKFWRLKEFPIIWFSILVMVTLQHSVVQYMTGILSSVCSSSSVFSGLKTLAIVQLVIILLAVCIKELHFRMTIRNPRVKKRERAALKPNNSVPSWDDINMDWRDSSSCALRHILVLRNSECVEQKGGMKKDRQGWELSGWIRRTAPNMRLLEVLREMGIQLRFAAIVLLNQAAICSALQATNTNNWIKMQHPLNDILHTKKKTNIIPNKKQYNENRDIARLLSSHFFKLQVFFKVHDSHCDCNAF